MICPWCNRDVESFHPNSHTLPEWMHKPIFSSKDRAGLVISFRDNGVAKRQSGFKWSFICHDCETSFGKHDRYGSLILTDKSPGSPEYKAIVRQTHSVDPVSGESWTGFDFKRLQSFVFSIALRHHLAMISEGRRHLLTNYHFQRMKGLFESSSSDWSSYPFIMARIVDGDALALLPFRDRVEGERVIRFAGAGYYFEIHVSVRCRDARIVTAAVRPDWLPMPKLRMVDIGAIRGGSSVLAEVSNAHGERIRRWFPKEQENA